MTNRKELLREFLLMNLGTLLVSVGVYFFKFPNHFSMGGVSGLAVLLGKLLPQLSPSTFNTIINVLFLVLGFVFRKNLRRMSRVTVKYSILVGLSTVPFSPPGSFSSLSGRFPWTALSPTNSCWSCSSR